LLKLGDNVQANIRELILEHLKEHRKKVSNSPRDIISDWLGFVEIGGTNSSLPKMGASPLI
jgi:hypothetical protein